MVTLKSLTPWIECPKSMLSHINIKFCFTCNCYVGLVNKQLQCNYEEK